MDFLKIFFTEETKVGLCAFEDIKTSRSTLRTDFLNHFENKRTFASNFDKNILLV